MMRYDLTHVSNERFQGSTYFLLVYFTLSKIRWSTDLDAIAWLNDNQCAWSNAMSEEKSEWRQSALLRR